MPDKKILGFDNLHKNQTTCGLSKQSVQSSPQLRKRTMYRRANDSVQRKESSNLFEAIYAKIYGFKNWARYGASGYTYKVQLYQGKKQLKICHVTNKCSAIVLKLTKELSPGTFVFTNNLFSSMELLKELNERGLNFVCTFRGNRLREAQTKMTEKTF